MLGVILGAEGHLCDLEENQINYQDQLPTASTSLYYHMSDIEKARMFPADPLFSDFEIDSGESNGSDTHSSAFRDIIEARDKNCCLTGRDSIVRMRCSPFDTL